MSTDWEAKAHRLAEAIRLTHEYIDSAGETLPCTEGWSWWDALVDYDPEYAEQYRQQVQRQHRLKNGLPEQECDRCGLSQTITVTVNQNHQYLLDRSRFPGAQLWDAALVAVEYVDSLHPRREWDYMDNHGQVYRWDTRITQYPHKYLYVSHAAVVY